MEQEPIDRSERIMEPLADRLRRNEVFSMVTEERIRQIQKWGRQQHDDGTGRTGDTEVMEFKKALCESRFYRGVSRGHRWIKEHAAEEGQEVVTWRDIADEEDAEVNAETDKAKLLAELIQSIAVKTAWAEDLLEQRENEEW